MGPLWRLYWDCL